MVRYKVEYCISGVTAVMMVVAERPRGEGDTRRNTGETEILLTKRRCNKDKRRK